MVASPFAATVVTAMLQYDCYAAKVVWGSEFGGDLGKQGPFGKNRRS